MEGSESPPGARARARQWARATSVVPGCSLPCEEVMSLNTIWQASGTLGCCPGLAPRQGGQMEWSSTQSTGLGSLTRFPQS